MKKLLAILSMAAIAAPAFADQPVAGTAEAPNYYLIVANRGIPYLGYDATGNGTTHLLRTNEVSAANVWAVTPGSAEGTVVIKNATADAYLMDFVIDGVSTTAAGATAVTTSTPTDIFLVEQSGAYAINIISATAEYAEKCYSLDATGGDVASCGNWLPTQPSTGEGGCWWFYKIDAADGGNFEQGIRSYIETYVAAPAIEGLEAYKTAVPSVAAELQAGIDAINALTDVSVSGVYAAYDAAIAAANAKLQTVFDGQTCIFENLRRIQWGTGQYLNVDVANNTYVGSTYIDNATGKFLLTAKDGGYIAYNAETKTYIGATADGVTTPVASEAEAFVFTPILYSNAGFTGLALCKAPVEQGWGFNWQAYSDGIFGFYYIADGGSIWTLVNDDPEVLVEKVTSGIVAELQAYIPNVPVVADIINKAVADLKALTYDANLAANAEAIRTKAIEDANALIISNLAGKSFAIKNLRAGDFLCVVDGSYNHAADYSADTALFTFKPAANGGYTVYNAVAGIYVGPKVADEGLTELTMVTDEAEAIACWPALHHNGDYYGVAFHLTAEKNGNALNMNQQAALHTYYVDDPGSIFGFFEADPAALNEITRAEAPEMTGIYDLQGRKLAVPVRGINIINGKKVYVK